MIPLRPIAALRVIRAAPKLTHAHQYHRFVM